MSDYEYRITEYNGNYYVNKKHPCGVWEAITWGTYEYCLAFMDKLKGQQTLFELDEIQEARK